MFIQSSFAKLKFKPDAWDSAAPWADVDIVRNVTVTAEANEIDVTTRGNSGFRQTIPGLREITLEFELAWTPGDPAFEAIKNAYLPAAVGGGATIAFAALDQDGPTGNGPVGDFSIVNFSRSEEIGDALTLNVTAKLVRFGQWTTNGVS